MYGVTVEEVLDHLNNEDKELFYLLAGKQQKGLKKKETQLKIAELYDKIRKIKENNDRKRTI